MLVRTPSATTFEVGPDGILLAYDPPGAPFAQATHALAGGTTLVLYTDGLVERRDSDHLERAELLRWSVEHGPDDPDALVQTLIERMVKPGAADDVAVVAVRIS